MIPVRGSLPPPPPWYLDAGGFANVLAELRGLAK